MDATTLTLTVTSLVISILAAVGTINQAWWARRAATRTFVVEARHGFAGRGGVVSKAQIVSPAEAQRYIAQGYGQAVFGAVVRNVGALPIVVTKWSVVMARGWEFSPVGESIGPSLPHQIPAGGSQDWWVPVEVIVTAANAAQSVGADLQPVQVVVECGDGGRRMSQRLVPGA